MITAYIYKKNSKVRYSTVRLNLLPEKIIFHFKQQSFCISQNEIHDYFILGNKITLIMENIGLKSHFTVIIETNNESDLEIIDKHIKSCVDKSINKAVINPIFYNVHYNIVNL